MFQLSEDYHSVNEELYFEDLFEYKTIKTTKQITYYNDVVAFDIETTSFKDFDEDQITVNDEEVYSYLLGTKIRIPQSIYSELPDFNGIRRQLFGRMYFSKTDGIRIDSLYHDLNNQFPYYFPEDIYNQADQLEKIISVFYDNMPGHHDEIDDKRAIMYVWQVAINGTVIIGRTWEEFINLCTEISQEFCLCDSRRMIFWVHSLAYEFGFIKDLFKWSKVFAAKQRKPIFALSTLGIEFRCSYILSNLSLANVGRSLTKFKIEKLSGEEFNYELPRHNQTPLQDFELRYCCHDVLVVSAYIKEKMLEVGDDISKLPLTCTGYCRNFVRNNCLSAHGKQARDEQFRHYHNNIIKRLKIKDLAEYAQLTRAFMGGFTHCSCRWSGKILNEVDSFDFTSSYPYVIVSEKRFPMSKGKLVEVKSEKELKEYCNNFCVIFDAKFTNIKPKYINENYIPVSKCLNENLKPLTTEQKKNMPWTTNNGRLVGCESDIYITLTDIDMEIIGKTYKWDKLSIGSCRIYKRGYLPKEIIMSVLTLYKDKTELKGVKDMEDFYQRQKGLLNSIFGCMVTSIIMPVHTYGPNGWTTEKADAEKELKKYNNSKKRFLFYPWGVYVTAIARRNLWSGILAFGDDYAYSDTDSLKVVNADKHLNYINAYNRMVERKLKMVSKHFNIPFDMFAPKTIKGEVKMLGIWDKETENGKWKKYKSLGAKRYMILTADDELTLTVSGVNKKAAIPYLIDKYGKDGAFDAFTENLTIPGEYTGKLIHYYIDEPHEGYITDYLGNTIKYKEKSGIYMEKASYSFSMEAAYLEYLQEIQGALIT